MVERPVGRATLTLISRPSARVSVNGRGVGNTPVYRASIPAGNVRVRLQPIGAGTPQTIVLRGIQPGQNVSRNIDLR